MSKLVFCEEWGEKLAARHPEDLSPTEQANLHQHLQGCSQCAAAYAAFNALEAHILELPQAGPLPSLLPKLQDVQQDPAPFSVPSSGILEIHVQGDARLSEVVSYEVEDTELAVEDVMCNVLLHLFGGGTVEDVTVQFFSDSQQRRRFSIQIYLQCAFKQFILRPRTKEHIQSAVEEYSHTLLRELFVSLEIDNVKLVRTPWVYECANEDDSDEVLDTEEQEMHTDDTRPDPNASRSRLDID